MLDRHALVAHVALDHAGTAAVFRRHRIDYYSHGDVSVEVAAERRGVDLEVLLRDLGVAIASAPAPRFQARALATPELVTHIVSRYHAPLRRALPRLNRLAARIARAHRTRAPELRVLEAAVAAASAALLAHLDEEEDIVFPELGAGNHEVTASCGLLGEMADDHLMVVSLLEEVRAAAHDFVPPAWLDGARMLYRELELLEASVFEHMLLENHVLKPRFVTEPALCDWSGADACAC